MKKYNIKELGLDANKIEEFLNMFSDKLDFRNPIHISNFIEFIKENFGKVSLFTQTFEEGDKIFTRARKHNNPRTLFPNLSDLWYPPKDFTGVSRANIPTKQIFYSSNDPGTTLFEVRPKLGDWVTSIDMEVRIPKLEMKVMGINYEEFGIDEKEIPHLERGLHKFWEKQFKEEIPSDKTYLYYKTALFIDGYIGKDENGVIYPSRASNLKGWNFAFTKEFADEHLNFKRATVHEITNKKSEFDFDVKCLYRSENINQYKDFIWKRVTDCSGHNITENIYDN